MLKEPLKETKNLNTGESFDKKNVRIIKKTIIGNIVFKKEDEEDAISK
jgi:hypothetical protein